MLRRQSTKRVRGLPVSELQIKMHPSSSPEAISLLSGERDTKSTLAKCFLRIFSPVPVATSHTRTVLSLLPETISLPSDENSAQIT